jgi:hypothetical protein
MGAPRPLLCTQCGQQVSIAEDVSAYADYGEAVIDSDGVVHPAVKSFELHADDPIRARAYCTNPDCRHQWTLRRRFDPERGKEKPPEPWGITMHR